MSGKQSSGEAVKAAQRVVRWRLRQLASVAVIISATGLGLVSSPSEVFHFPNRYWLSVIFALCLIIALGARVYLTEKNMTARGWLPTPPAPTPSVAADETYRNFLENEVARTRFSPEQVLHLVSFMTDPSGHLLRVSESIELHSNYYSAKVNRVLNSGRPSDRRSPILPILRQKKGVLIDQLSVTQDGKSVSTLSYAESQGCTLVVINDLFRSCFPIVDGEPREGEHSSAPAALKDRAVQELERSSVLAALKDRAVQELPGEPGRSNDSSVTALLAQLEGLEDRATSESARRSWAALRELARMIDDHYFVYAQVEVDDKRPTRLCVSSNVALGLAGASVGDALRSTFGLSRRSHILPLSHATEAPSYHVNVSVPSGLYVFHAQWLPATRKDLAVPDSASLPAPQDAALPRRARRPTSLSSPLGRAYWHGYLRDIDGYTHDLEPQDPHKPRTQLAVCLMLELRERPPGLLGVVTLLSFYLFTLTWWVGLYLDDVFPTEANAGSGVWSMVFRIPQTQSSSVPTVLFGIPAIFSAWLASRYTAKTLSRVSLSTLVLTFWVLLNAGAAVGIAALKSSGVNVTGGGPFLGVRIDFLGWGILEVSCALSLAVSIWYLMGKIYRHRWVSRSTIMLDS